MEEYTIYFNAGYGQGSLNFTRFLLDVQKRINSDEEIIERVKANNKSFREALIKEIENSDPECTGRAVLDLITRTPRYSYIKHLQFDGKEYIAEIDALEREFTVAEA